MTAEPVSSDSSPVTPVEEADPANADRFLDLAKRLIAVPKHEIDRLRHHERDDRPQPE
jgi:hypothetical protein